MIDADVSCTAQAGYAPLPPPPPLPVPAAVLDRSKWKAPTGAAGFDFAHDLASAKATCEGAGKVWTSNDAAVATCSSPVVDLGFEALVTLKFCGDVTCAIALRVDPSGDWLPTVVALKTKLSEKYGEPSSSNSLPSSCRAEPGFTQCVKEKDERLQYSWAWRSGESLRLVVGKPTHVDGPPAIRLQYQRAERAKVDSTGL
jgi:hypothetical protein